MTQVVIAFARVIPGTECAHLSWSTNSVFPRASSVLGSQPIDLHTSDWGGISSFYLQLIFFYLY